MRRRTRRRQRRLIREIRATWQYGPSLLDLAVWAGIPYVTAWRYVYQLAARGEVRILNPGQNRVDGSRLKVAPTDPESGGGLESGEA